MSHKRLASGEADLELRTRRRCGRLWAVAVGRTRGDRETTGSVRRRGAWRDLFFDRIDLCRPSLGVRHPATSAALSAVPSSTTSSRTWLQAFSTSRKSGGAVSPPATGL